MSLCCWLCSWIGTNRYVLFLTFIYSICFAKKKYVKWRCFKKKSVLLDKLWCSFMKKSAGKLVPSILENFDVWSHLLYRKWFGNFKKRSERQNVFENVDVHITLQYILMCNLLQHSCHFQPKSFSPCTSFLRPKWYWRTSERMIQKYQLMYN